MLPVLLRTFVCLLLLVCGAVALAPTFGWNAAVTLSAILAFAINTYWRDRQLRRLHRELREAIEGEEAMRHGRE
jgi:membrane protein implicated in regulation of membrane protease activity